MRFPKIVLLSCFALLPLAGQAQRPINPRPIVMPEREEDSKERAEEAVTPPEFFKDEDLIAFDVSAANSNRFFIDSKSIALGKDDVVRYTLVIRSSAGVQNVSHEGIRCATRERKLYALGRPDGSWVAARVQKWSSVTGSGAVTPQRILMNDFFCPKEVSVKSVDEAVGALRARIHPRVRTKAQR